MGKRNEDSEDGAEAPIKPVDYDELPQEFKRFEKPFGLDLHVFYFIKLGLIIHACMIYYLYLLFWGHIPKYTLPILFIHGYASAFGTTVGCHRYWCHKTFKANKPFQVLLMLLQTLSFQFPIFKWCRDHRVHHKYTDSNADPYSAHRGFWFSHVTWLFQPRHPDCDKGLKIIDLSDLVKDPIVRFQSKYYWELCLVFCFFLPMAHFRHSIPELSLFHSFVTNVFRIGISLHVTFLVNSAAHIYGNKPYDQHMTAIENKWISILAVGEGWHNYHHTFPWDYKAAEFGNRYNLSTAFIHFFATIGWAWDLKTVSHKLLVDRINRTGDGSHPFHKEGPINTEAKVDQPESACWGWGDEELKKEDVEITETVFPAKYPRG